MGLIGIWLARTALCTHVHYYRFAASGEGELVQKLWREAGALRPGRKKVISAGVSLTAVKEIVYSVIG